MSNSNKTEVTNNGIGFLGLLTIVLITLKLTGLVDLSWWLVTLPLWMPTAIVLFILVLVFIGWCVLLYKEKRHFKVKRKL